MELTDEMPQCTEQVDGAKRLYMQDFDCTVITPSMVTFSSRKHEEHFYGLQMNRTVSAFAKIIVHLDKEKYTLSYSSEETMRADYDRLLAALGNLDKPE